MEPFVCGIYKITCTETGLSYIGQSKDIGFRFKRHMKGSGNVIPTGKLARAIEKFGPENFELEVLEECEEHELNDLEVKYINNEKTYGEFGYNTVFSPYNTRKTK